jgi:hypothetical protein
MSLWLACGCWEPSFFLAGSCWLTLGSTWWWTNNTWQRLTTPDIVWKQLKALEKTWQHWTTLDSICAG